MLNDTTKKFDESIGEMKTTALTPEEKVKIKSNLLQFIKTYSPASEKPAPAAFTWQPLSFAKKLVFPYAAAGVTIAALAGYGICSAAQASLPGDFLYPIKTKVNEKVMSLVQFSDTAKATYNIHLVDTRLQEVEQLASKKSVDSKQSTAINNLLNKNINEAEENIKNIENQQQPQQKIEATSNLEVSLNSHAEVLDKIKTKHDGEGLDTIIQNVKDKAKEIHLDLPEL